jgi:autoinducer 2 (AI-2) kinase
LLAETDRVVVIDAGTSSLRAISVRFDGTAETMASVPWPMFIPDDAAPFGREFDAPATAAAIRAVVADHGEGAVALAFTGQREGIVFLDSAGEVALASPNIDARASSQGMVIDAARGDAVYAATGHLPSLLQAPAKLAWLREHRPDEAARVTRVLPLADWAASVVAGDCGMSRSLAAETGLLDVRSGDPPGALLNASSFAAALLPRLVSEICVAGRRSATPVVHAGADTQCALVGMGVIDDGQCGVPTGWSAPVQLVTTSPVFDSKMRTWTSLHVVPERWILESNAGETGRAWDWTCAMLNCSPAEGSALASAAPVGSDDVMSVVTARAMHAAAMNAGIGAITVPLPLTMSAPTRAHVLRSLLESIAYAVRANVEQIEAIAGPRIECLALGGGMSRSALFSRIVADVLDRPVGVAASPETSAVGAAVLAAVAIGRFASEHEAAEAMVKPPVTLEPDARASAQYEDHYARWCATTDGMERLGGL